MKGLGRRRSAPQADPTAGTVRAGTAEEDRRDRPAVRADNPERAVLFMALAAVLIPLLNASAKYLAAAYPVLEITWARYAGHFVYMLIAFAPTRGSRLLVSSRPVLQLTRSALLCASTLIFISALAYIPLSTATAVSFTGPLIVTALSPLVLREEVGGARWIAVAIGFFGALVVVRPGSGAQHWAAFLIFASATCSAFYQLLSRKLASHDRAETSITYIALAGFVLTSIPLPLVWVTPTGYRDALLFVSLGLFGGFGHYFMVRAYELAPAPFVSPFNYAQILGAALLGYLVFGYIPDPWTWIGAAIIASSGIFILYRERRRSRPG